MKSDVFVFSVISLIVFKAALLALSVVNPARPTARCKCCGAQVAVPGGFVKELEACEQCPPLLPVEAPPALESPPVPPPDL